MVSGAIYYALAPHDTALQSLALCQNFAGPFLHVLLRK